MAARKTRSTVEPIRGVSIRKTAAGAEYIQLRFTYKGEVYRPSLGVRPTNDNIRAANRKLEEIKLSISMGTFDPNTAVIVNRPLIKEGPTIGQRITDRMNRMHSTGSWGDSTYSSRVTMYECHLKGEFGDLYIKELTTPLFEDWLKSRGDISVGYVDQVLTLLNPIVEKALHEGEIDQHPYQHIKRSEYLRTVTGKDRREKINPLTKSEIGRFLNACEGPWRFFWQLMFFTGMRLQEIVVLRWEDLDFVERTVHISRAIGITNGGKREYLKETKTEESDRVIEPVDQAWDALMAMREHSQLAGGFIFPSEIMNDRPDTSYEWTSRPMVTNRWHRALVKAKLSRANRSPKQARHTYATMMLFEGESPINVAHSMGHTSIEMLQQHYAKWMKDAKRKRFNVDFDLGSKDNAAAQQESV